MSGKDGGWTLPNPVDPPNRKAVCICLPDEINHVIAFWGNLQNLGYWFNWQRDPDHKGLETSILWNQIIAEAHAKWIEGTMCTSCSELIECLQPLFDELGAKIDSIQSGINDLKFGAGNSPAGEPLSTEQLQENQAGESNPSCDKDILWAQCLQLVQYTNQLIVDGLQAAESATNSVEFLEVLSGLPGIDEVGADVIAGYMSLLQDGIQENYEAEYTETLEQQIACAIFCLCQSDCVINIERVNDVYHSLVDPFFADVPAIFATLSEFMSYFVNQDVGSDVVVYLLHYMIWAGGALANIFLGDIGTKPLQTLLLLAVNDANNDWEILCTDCPSEWSHSWNLREGMTDWSFVELEGITWGEWADTVGAVATYASDAPPSVLKQFIIQITVPANAGSTLTSFLFNYDLDKAYIEPATTGRDSLKRNGGNLWSIVPTTLADAFEEDYLIDGLSPELAEGDVLELRIICQRVFTSAPEDGFAGCHTITMTGTGVDPWA